MVKKKTANIYVMSGPSAVGKDTIIENLQKTNNNFHFVVTATTRKPRKNEKEGINHFFYSKETFKKLIKNNDLIEWAKVYKNYYGVPKSQIFEPLKNNKDVLLRVDVQGAKRIKELIPDVILIFIKPERTESLRKRLIERGVNTTTEMDTRLKTAEREIQTSNLFDFIIVNKDGDLQYAVKKVLDIIKGIKN
ncbi:MAG: guanylate kinase [Chloroflexota bacterium]|nr:guanylate kinase [Chloroflexota bacterium]